VIPQSSLVNSGRSPVLDADLIAAATRACPLVADLHSGAYGEVATYLPGRRVPGVRITPVAVEIHVVGHLAPSMSWIAAQIRDAVKDRVGGLPVDVTIEDVVVPGAVPARPAPTSDPAGPTSPATPVPSTTYTAPATYRRST
jgi:hypothetical protein